MFASGTKRAWVRPPGEVIVMVSYVMPVCGRYRSGRVPASPARN
jgi:hypothetical protein